MSNRTIRDGQKAVQAVRNKIQNKFFNENFDLKKIVQSFRNDVLDD